MEALRRPLAATIALLCVVLAFVVARTEPQENVGFGPFAVRVELGEVGEGRGLQGVVDGARFADVVSIGRWTGETRGVWFVVDVRMATTENPSLAYATLHVGERHWASSNRPGDGSLDGVVFEAGLPNQGAFVFEVPADLVDDPAARSARIQLADDLDTRLITVIEVELDLTQLEHTAELDVPSSERTQW